MTDIFIANGTAWFYSRGGKRPWEFLHASTKNIKELGFADIDNDGVTDVLYRDPQGNVGFPKSGREDLAPLTTSPVPMKDVRFGDFDGDGKTDMFITHRNQWRVWRGATKAWEVVNTSPKAISELLFGEFDLVRHHPGATPNRYEKRPARRQAVGQIEYTHEADRGAMILDMARECYGATLTQVTTDLSTLVIVEIDIDTDFPDANLRCLFRFDTLQ